MSDDLSDLILFVSLQIKLWPKKDVETLKAAITGLFSSVNDILSKLESNSNTIKGKTKFITGEVILGTTSTADAIQADNKQAEIYSISEPSSLITGSQYANQLVGKYPTYSTDNLPEQLIETYLDPIITDSVSMNYTWTGAYDRPVPIFPDSPLWEESSWTTLFDSIIYTDYSKPALKFNFHPTLMEVSHLMRGINPLDQRIPGIHIKENTPSLKGKSTVGTVILEATPEQTDNFQLAMNKKLWEQGTRTVTLKGALKMSVQCSLIKIIAPE